LDTGRAAEPPTAIERIDTAAEHVRAQVEASGEKSFVRMRKHVAWYVAGLPGATYMRARVNEVATSDELLALIAEYRAYVESR
jgi:tRNA-dihydrouridine synthase